MADPHAYGSADPDNRETPAVNGFRGEEKAPLEKPDPDRTRTEVAEGRTIVVEESSGIAAAEAAGNIGKDVDPDGEETAGSG